ncbi:MAG: hypothetical protein AB1679_12430 [Actinomycetota bacterium]
MSHLDTAGWIHEGQREPERFPYLARVTDLPPLVAQAAFDGVRVARRDSGWPARWMVRVPGGCLRLCGQGRVPPPPRPCYWWLRTVSGTLRSASWWRPAVPVHLELVEWSTTRTALGLTVRGPHHLASAAVYQRVGPAALDILAADLDAWALHELHELEERLAAA